MKLRESYFNIIDIDKRYRFIGITTWPFRYPASDGSVGQIPNIVAEYSAKHAPGSFFSQKPKTSRNKKMLTCSDLLKCRGRSNPYFSPNIFFCWNIRSYPASGLQISGISGKISFRYYSRPVMKFRGENPNTGTKLARLSATVPVGRHLLP